MTLNETLKTYSDLVEQALKEALPDNSLPQGEVVRAMEYSLLGGGKRIRPALCLEFYRLCGGNVEDVLPFACAIEMIHTYSLIHDDLPCMDNDDMRRGKPSCHKAFSEDIALLAGDALLNLAFETALKTKLPSDRVVKALSLLGKASGVEGMIGGQVLDLESEDKKISLDELKQIHMGKTVAMLTVPAQIALTLAGAEDKMESVVTYCQSIGLAFQIRDDILDVIGDEQTLGKPIGSDADNNKNTYVSLLGLEESLALVSNLTDKAVTALDVFSNDADVLKELALVLRDRKS